MKPRSILVLTTILVLLLFSTAWWHASAITGYKYIEASYEVGNVVGIDINNTSLAFGTLPPNSYAKKHVTVPEAGFTYIYTEAPALTTTRNPTPSELITFYVKPNKEPGNYTFNILLVQTKRSAPLLRYVYNNYYFAEATQTKPTQKPNLYINVSGNQTQENTP